MTYNVLLTDFAEWQLNKIIEYVAVTLSNSTAAGAILDDIDEAIEQLTTMADCFAPCEEPELAQFGYYRFHLKRHRYVMLYRIKGYDVYIDRIYHELQDYSYLV